MGEREVNGRMVIVRCRAGADSGYVPSRSLCGDEKNWREGREEELDEREGQFSCDVRKLNQQNVGPLRLCWSGGSGGGRGKRRWARVEEDDDFVRHKKDQGDGR